jgi:hypothetical protein
MKGNQAVTMRSADGAQTPSDFSIFNFQFSISANEEAAS